MNTPVMDTAVIADVSVRIAALFVKLPMLTGFSGQHSASLSRDRNSAPLVGELCIADVSVDAWPGWQAGPAVHDEIAQTLLELLNDRPDAYDRLPGQTSPRT